MCIEQAVWTADLRRITAVFVLLKGTPSGKMTFARNVRPVGGCSAGSERVTC